MTVSLHVASTGGGGGGARLSRLPLDPPTADYGGFNFRRCICHRRYCR